jgi:protoheme IX farnesyltransferase
VLKDYYRLTKPGIIYGNAITTAGGFLLASKGHASIFLFIATLLGISLTIAASCVFNNYIDRDIDALMERTKDRALVAGRISTRAALVFGSILLLLGAAVLILFTNLIALAVALFGVFAYVFFYSMWSKRNTIHATVIGSLSGSVPPVVGYVAVTNGLDAGALVLFLILSVWQLPHAFAIGIYHFDDYANAVIPVLPVKIGIYKTKIWITLCILGFAIASSLLTLLGYTGYIYLTVMTLLSFCWLLYSIYGFWVKDDKHWGRTMFIFSLIVILLRRRRDSNSRYLSVCRLSKAVH